MINNNLIKEVIVRGSAVTQVDLDLTSAPIQKGELYELVCTFINTTGSTSEPKLYANDNTTSSNYYSQRIRANGASVSGRRLNDANSFEVEGGKSSKTKTYIKLSNDGKLVYFTKNVRNLDNAIEISDNFGTSTVTLTNITKLNIVASISNSIGINSRIQLYKVAEKIKDIEVTGSATTQVDITGINIGKGDEYILVSDIERNITGTNDIVIYFNGDQTDANYYNQRIRGNNTSISGIRENKPTLGRVYYDVPNVATELFITKIKVANSGYVNYQTNEVGRAGIPEIELLKYYGNTTFTVSNITTISLVNEQSNGIGIGSRFELYKLLA